MGSTLHVTRIDFDLRLHFTASEANGTWFDRVSPETRDPESTQYEEYEGGRRVWWHSRGRRGEGMVGRTFNAAIQHSMQAGLQANLDGLRRFFVQSAQDPGSK